IYTKIYVSKRQQITIDLYLNMSPQVLLLDEPTASLDAASCELVETLMREFLAEVASSPRYLIFTSHQSNQVGRLADRIIELERGHVVSDQQQPR
ncbi:MAG: hypothetical protein RJA17_720, partial [Pseudomonadota bacterium]